MMNGLTRVCIACTFAAAFLAHPGVVGAASVGAFSATISKVDHLRVGSSEPVVAKTGDAVALKDVVETKQKSRAQVTFVDETVLRIASLSQIEITEFMFDNSRLQNGSIKMIRGTLRSIVHSTPGETHFEVVTPTAVAAARGTDFFTVVMGKVTRFVCNEGAVEIRNINPGVSGTQMCVAGQTVDVQQGQAPTSPSPTNPRLLEQLIERTAMIEAGVGMTTVGMLTGLLGGTLGIILGNSDSGTPPGALPGGGGVTAVENAVHLMLAWNPAMSFDVPTFGDMLTMTVTRNAGGNITSVTIAGNHRTQTPVANAVGPTPINYTFSTPVANPQALGLTGAGTPASIAASSISINRVGEHDVLPVRNYQYVDLFHWGVQVAPAGNWLAGVGVTGTLTPQAAMPVAGTATYNGVADGTFYGATTDDFTANMVAAVDFTNHTIGITFNGSASFDAAGNPTVNALNTVMNNMVGTVTRATWLAGANTFNSATFTNGATAAPPMQGNLSGGFYGPNTSVVTLGTAAAKPVNIGGTFGATDGTSNIVGVFAGQ